MRTFFRPGNFNLLAVSLVLVVWLFLISTTCADESSPHSAPHLTTQPAWPFSNDATIPEKVDAVLAQMNLDEKIGQMALFTSSGAITGPSGGSPGFGGPNP
jgi:hypothetical protein